MCFVALLWPWLQCNALVWCMIVFVFACLKTACSAWAKHESNYSRKLFHQQEPSTLNLQCHNSERPWTRRCTGSATSRMKCKHCIHKHAVNGSYSLLCWTCLLQNYWFLENSLIVPVWGKPLRILRMPTSHLRRRWMTTVTDRWGRPATVLMEGTCQLSVGGMLGMLNTARWTKYTIVHKAHQSRTQKHCFSTQQQWKSQSNHEHG